MKFECEIWLAEHWNLRHNIAQNAADGGYTKKFVARNVAEVGRNSTAAILRTAILGVDTRCNLAIARNIAPCIRTLTEFSELTRTPSRKYFYFWKAMINTATKTILVQLCYYMTREFLSTLSRINRQTSISTEKCFRLAQKPCGGVGKRKYNLNGISTALRRHFRWKLFAFLRFLDYSYWPVRDLALVLADAANMSTPEKKPLGCLNLMVLEDV